MNNTKQNLSIQLGDGRRLAFAEYGNPVGKPVLLMHGAPGSRLEHHPDLKLLDELHVRLIVPDRPDYGGSDPVANRTLLSWADDVAALMDHLELSTAAMLGFSGGGPYAMACASRMPERVSRLGLASSLAPMDIPGLTEGMNEQTRALYALAQADPSAFAAQIVALATSPEVVYQIMTAGLPPEDAVLFEDKAMRTMYMSDMAMAIETGVEGIVSDMLLYTLPWGFNPSDISCETLLWQGMRDINVPPAMGQHLAAVIPACRSEFSTNLGHYLLFARWREILEAVAA